MRAEITQMQNATTAYAEPSNRPGDEMGKNEFLKLLLTQLSYQDPMSPMDNEGMLEQLTQFAQLEEMENVSKSIDSLLSVTGAGNAANSVSLLGRDVRVDTNEFRGPKANVQYQLDSDAQEIKIEVRDKNNQVVRVIENIPREKGAHNLEIEGLEDKDYQFAVVGKDAQGNELKANLSVMERVLGVNFTTAIPKLIFGSGRELEITQVLEIKVPEV
jgi:flagellar basal-body rod modification protein FlgD